MKRADIHVVMLIALIYYLFSTDSLVFNNECYCFSWFSQLYAIYLLFFRIRYVTFPFFSKKILFTLWLTVEYLHFIWHKLSVHVT